MLRLYIGNGMPCFNRWVGYRRHRAFGHQHLRPVGLQRPLIVDPEEPLVAFHKEVALRHVQLQRRTPHTLAQQPLEPAGHLHHTLEHLAVHLLCFCLRIAHKMRPCPQAPLPTPLITNHSAHLPTVGIVDTITLFCHNT